MARNPARENKAEEEPDTSGQHLTSGDIARMLHVDLKTIHNWVNQGHILGRRTLGRHLRFDRTEVVRFMRVYGYPIPEGVGAPLANLAVQESETGRAAWAKGLRRGAEVTTFRSLFECTLLVAAGEQEIVFLDLDQCDLKRVREFLEALQVWPFTRGLAVVGIAEKASTRRTFLTFGGHVALASAKANDARLLSRWLTGSEEKRPESCEILDASV